MIIGAHVSAAGGIGNAIDRAVEIKALAPRRSRFSARPPGRGGSRR